MNPLLSILIPTVPERFDQANALFEKISEQNPGRAEILMMSDNRARSIGLKRNSLLQCARGKYVAFCDDDDNVAPDYMATLCNMAKVDVDVLTFRQEAKWNDAKTTVEFRIHHPLNGIFLAGGVTKRFPWHSCAWRRELAQKCLYTDKDFGEDYDWVLQANELVRTEAYNPKVLHYYTHRDDTSLAKR
jgi:glycosyltransferase involved in cell wall biosynthesis